MSTPTTATSQAVARPASARRGSARSASARSASARPASDRTAADRSATRSRPVAVASPAAMTQARWQADLFETPLVAAGARQTVSVRGAYQDALYGRALILDLRERATDAQRLSADLALVVRPGVDLAALAGYRALYLLVGDGAGPVVEPAQIAAFHPGRPRVEVIDGGFAAWVAAGLPVPASSR